MGERVSLDRDHQPVERIEVSAFFFRTWTFSIFKSGSTFDQNVNYFQIQTIEFGNAPPGERLIKGLLYFQYNFYYDFHLPNSL